MMGRARSSWGSQVFACKYMCDAKSAELQINAHFLVLISKTVSVSLDSLDRLLTEEYPSRFDPSV
jgi:hypothetical protein